MSDGCTVGPTRRVSLRETPENYFAEASNTAVILVVVLCSFLTAWMGK